MVQYARFGNFCSNLRTFQNFDSAVIFNGIHYRSSYLSITSCNTLYIYRMRCFLQVFSCDSSSRSPPVRLYVRTYVRTSVTKFKKITHIVANNVLWLVQCGYRVAKTCEPS